jgi:hypothetical protein
MKTVKDFKDAGLVFAEGDIMQGNAENQSLENSCLRGLMEINSRLPVRITDQWIVNSFAWRKNTGVKPDFDGEIEWTGKSVLALYEINIGKLKWGPTVHKWRPLLNQPGTVQTETNEEKEFFDKCKDKDGIFYKGFSAQEFLDKCNATPDLEPVFTQEMSDNGELPPIDSYFMHKGKKVQTISTTKEISGVVTYLTEDGEIDCCWNNAQCVQPLTEPLIEGNAYMFDYKCASYIGIYASAPHRFIKVGGFTLSSYCTNIRPMTVEKK